MTDCADPAPEHPRGDAVFVGHARADEAPFAHRAEDLEAETLWVVFVIGVEHDQLPHSEVAVERWRLDVVLVDVARDDLEREGRNETFFPRLPGADPAIGPHPWQDVEVRRDAHPGVAAAEVDELVGPGERTNAA